MSNKSKSVAAVLCVFLGTIGAHRFYAGHAGLGVLMTLIAFTVILLPIVWIWALADLVVILLGKMKDQHGKYINK